jgi:CheY-like chemotaxis protein
MSSQPWVDNNSRRAVAANHFKLVLSVDDEPNILSIREVILEAEGYAVLSAPNGERALELFDAHPEVGLVLLDYAMPGLNGGDVAREMKTRRPSVPIFMISAQEAALSKAICPFVDVFISKGYGPEHWLERMRQVFASRPALQRSA